MPEEYPPARHLLRDLRLEIERHGGETAVTAPVVAEIQTDQGGVRAGALGIAIDTFGGRVAIEAAAPDWCVTSDMHVHLLRPLTRGRLRVTGRALRAGRTQLVIEAEIRQARDSGQAIGPDETDWAEEAPLAAVATMTFTRLVRREDTPTYEPEETDRVVFAVEASRLDAPLLERLGVREIEAGTLELPLTPWVQNSLGALQGGALVTLVEAAAESRARAALGRPVVTTDFSVHYLALGRIGPLRARAEILRQTPERATLRVAVFDRGQDERLVATATATAGDL